MKVVIVDTSEDIQDMIAHAVNDRRKYLELCRTRQLTQTRGPLPISIQL